MNERALSATPIFLAEETLRESTTILAIDAPAIMRCGREQTVRKFYCAYVGPSMHPTLAARDLLEIAPYAGARRPEPGDVILCTAPIAHRYVVHRIIACTPSGFRTRGDNCSRIDPWLLTEGGIIGRVVAAHRQAGRRHVHGGRAGLLLAACCRLRRPVLSVLHVLLYPLSKAAGQGRRTGHLLSFLRRGLRLYSFGNREGTDYRLMAGGKTIGVYDHTIRRWRIRLPFRLFLNESALPSPANNSDQAE